MDELKQQNEGPLLAELAREFTDLGERLNRTRPERTPDTIVRFAVEYVPGADAASITTLRGRTFTTIATTSDLASQGDSLQYALGSGPCVDAVVNSSLYAPRDLATDQRWPRFGHLASSTLQIHSMLSYRFTTDLDDLIAGLNLYSTRPAVFDDQAIQLTLLLATHASLAVTAAVSQSRVGNLQHALQSNRDIGVAVGVLMSRHQLTRDQAFDVLRVASQQQNTKLHDIAVTVIHTGTLDLTPHAPPTPQDPAIAGYEVRVLGVLGPAARQGFAGVSVDVEPCATVLSGELDQADLYGLIERIKALGLELVDIRRI